MNGEATGRLQTRRSSDEGVMVIGLRVQLHMYTHMYPNEALGVVGLFVADHHLSCGVADCGVVPCTEDLPLVSVFRWAATAVAAGTAAIPPVDLERRSSQGLQLTGTIGQAALAKVTVWVRVIALPLRRSIRDLGGRPCVFVCRQLVRLISEAALLKLMSVFSGADAFRVGADMVMTARGESLKLPGALASSRVTQFGDRIIKGRRTETIIRDTT